MILSSSEDNTVKLWKTNGGSLIKTFKGHTDLVQTYFFMLFFTVIRCIAVVFLQMTHLCYLLLGIGLLNYGKATDP